MSGLIPSLALMGLFVTQPGTGAGASNVALIPLCDGARIDGLHDVLRSGLADRGFTVSDAPRDPVRPVRLCDEQAGRNLSTRLAKADDAFYALALTEAREALNALRQEMLLIGLPSEHGADYVHVMVLLARIALQNKERAEAEKIAAELLRVRPSFDIKAPELHPQVAALLESTAAKQKSAPRVALEVTTREPGVPIEIDGVAQCTTPCAIEGLTAGAHTLALRPRQGPTSAGQIQLDQSLELTLDAPRDWRAELTDALSGANPDAVTRLVQALAPGQRYAVLSSATPDGGGAVWLVDTEAKRFSALRFQQLDVRFTPDRVAVGLKTLEQQPVQLPAASAKKDRKRFGFTLALGPAKALTAPQRDAYGLGGAGLSRVWVSPEVLPEWLSLALSGGAVVLSGNRAPEAASVGVFGAGLRVAPRLGVSRLVLTAQGGAAVTDSLWRGFVGGELAVLFSAGPLELGPTVGYLRIFDGGAGDLAGDANLLFGGLTLGISWGVD